MNIVIVGKHWAVASGRYMRDAFIRERATVWTVGDGSNPDTLWGLPVDPMYHWLENPPPGETDIDAVVLMDSDPRFHAIALSIPAKRHIVYGVDNHVREYLPGADHYFLAHFHGPTQPVSNLGDKASWLPCGYDPTVFSASPLSWETREYDFCLIGVMYPERTRRIKLLRNAGYTVFAATGLLYEDCAKAYHNARISLCVSAAGDVAQRIFETAACGCLILSDPLHDLMDENTNRQLGLSGFALYQDDRELLTQAETLLGDEKHVAQGGVAAMLHHVRRHTWDERAKTILRWLQEER